MDRRTVRTRRQQSALLPQREAERRRHYTLSEEELQNIGSRRLLERYGWGMKVMPSQIDIEPTY